MALLLPMSSVAGSLALSFTGAAQTPAAGEPSTPPTTTPVVPEPPVLPDAAPIPVETPAVAPAPRPLSSDEMAREMDDARAAAPPPRANLSLLRPTERRFFFSLLVGGSKGLRGYSTYFPGMDFKLEAAIGGHGSRRRDLAGAFALEIRNQLGFTSLTFAPRLQWDKQIVPEHAVFFTTIAQVGYRMTIVPDGGGESDGYGGDYGSGLAVVHGGAAKIGWGVSAIVAERMLLTFRPANLEIDAPSPTVLVGVNWEVLGGIGVIW